jgi:hypothetical protein
MIFFRALIVSLILTSAFACSETFYESYSRSHPNWRPHPFPVRQGGLLDTIASLLAPREYGDYTFVRKIRVFRVSGHEWSELDYDLVTSKSFEQGPTDYHLVMAILTCQHSIYDYSYGNNGVAWYLISGNDLLAYEHLEFEYQCEAGGDRENNQQLPDSYLECVGRIAELAAVKREVASLARCGPPPVKKRDGV